MMALTNQFFILSNIINDIPPVIPGDIPDEDQVPDGSNKFEDIDIINNDKYSLLSNMILNLDAHQNAGINTFNPNATTWKNIAYPADTNNIRLPDVSFKNPTDNSPVTPCWSKMYKSIDRNEWCLSVHRSNFNSFCGVCDPVTIEQKNLLKNTLNDESFTIDFLIRLGGDKIGLNSVIKSTVSPISIISDTSKNPSDIFFNINFNEDTLNNYFHMNFLFKDAINKSNEIIAAELNPAYYIYIAIRPAEGYVGMNRCVFANICISPSSLDGINASINSPFNIGGGDLYPDPSIVTGSTTFNKIKYEKLKIFLNGFQNYKGNSNLTRDANVTSLNYCTFRIWNKKLSDAQIARNFKLDMTRYALVEIDSKGSGKLTRYPLA